MNMESPHFLESTHTLDYQLVTHNAMLRTQRIRISGNAPNKGYFFQIFVTISEKCSLIVRGNKASFLRDCHLGAGDIK